jgi:hypothetical protein
VVVNGVRNVVQGNVIGLDRNGTAALPNGGSGVTVNGNINLVGGTTVATRNVISGNAGNGVLVMSGAVLVQGNYIGIDVTGLAAVGNQANGVKVFGIDSVQVGGSDPGAGNVISGNGLFGVWLDDSSAEDSLYGNYVGTNRTGDGALPNIKGGVRLGGKDHEIGASFAGGRNLISGNHGPGIAVLSTSTGGKIRNNYIGTTLTGNAALGNDTGVEVGVGAGATSVQIGGSPYGEGNLISGNLGDGVLLFRGATVQGNYIGTDSTMLAPLPNDGNGIRVKGSNNLIGGLGFFNAVAFNHGHGVAVISESGSATGNSRQRRSGHRDRAGHGSAERCPGPGHRRQPAPELSDPRFSDRRFRGDPDDVHGALEQHAGIGLYRAVLQERRLRSVRVRRGSCHGEGDQRDDRCERKRPPERGLSHDDFQHVELHHRHGDGFFREYLRLL